MLDPTPYTVVIDTREQRPFAFAQPLGFARRRRSAPACRVVTTRGTLAQGDYSLAGHEHELAIERKSLADLFGTLGKGRARFYRELERLAAYRFAAVVVEADLATILTNPPAHSRLNPRSVVGSIIAWQQRFPAVHWWLTPGRAVAEAMTIRMLDRFWRDAQQQTRAKHTATGATDGK